MRFLIPLLVLISSLIQLGSTYKKGCAGKYYINGTAYLSKNEIKSAEFDVQLKDKKWSVQTDQNGHFEITIPWMSACPSGLSAAEREWENERLNPSPIVITYGESRIELKNEWKKYGKCFSESKEEITWKKDLHFNN